MRRSGNPKRLRSQMAFVPQAGGIVFRRDGDRIMILLVRVEYFLIEAQSESDETDGREKRWFTAEQASSAVAFDSARALLAEARRRLHA